MKVEPTNRIASLHTLFCDEAPALTRRLAERLGASGTGRYRLLPPVMLEQRAAALVTAFCRALAENPVTFVAYMRGLAEERQEQGFELREVQAAVNLLHEQAWTLITQRVALEQQVDFLGRMTAIIGAAKDALALEFLEKSDRLDLQARRLKKQLHLLFLGTVPSPLSEAEEMPGLADSKPTD